MPHHNRAILSEIAELDLDPEEKYVVGKDGALVQSKKNKPFYPEEQVQKEEKISVKPVEHKDFKKPAVLETVEEVVSTEKAEVQATVEELVSIEETVVDVTPEEVVTEEAQAAKKKKKTAKVQS